MTSVVSWLSFKKVNLTSIAASSITLMASAMWILASPAPAVSFAEELAIVALAATAGGLALATIRERSLSLWPGVGLQILGGLASLAFWYWLDSGPPLPF